MSGLEARRTLEVGSWLLGEEIDPALAGGDALARAPLTVRLGEGIAVLHRHGAVVLIGVAEAEARALFERLRPASAPPGEAHDVEQLRLAGPEEPDGVDASGTLVLETFDLPRLRVVAEALARSAVLSFYETHLAGVLAELETPIARLRRAGRLPFRTGKLLRSVGEVLETELHMIGRAEVAEKPEMVWDEPHLDRLYTRLADEFELVDRDRALSRKLDLVMRSVGVLMEALSARRTLRVEWAIFLLILVEIIMLS